MLRPAVEPEVSVREMFQRKQFLAMECLLVPSVASRCARVTCIGRSYGRTIPGDLAPWSFASKPFHTCVCMYACVRTCACMCVPVPSAQPRSVCAIPISEADGGGGERGRGGGPAAVLALAGLCFLWPVGPAPWPLMSPEGRGVVSNPSALLTCHRGARQARVTPAHGVQNGIVQTAPSLGRVWTRTCSLFIDF